MRGASGGAAPTGVAFVSFGGCGSIAEGRGAWVVPVVSFGGLGEVDGVVKHQASRDFCLGYEVTSPVRGQDGDVHNAIVFETVVMAAVTEGSLRSWRGCGGVNAVGSIGLGSFGAWRLEMDGIDGFRVRNFCPEMVSFFNSFVEMEIRVSLRRGQTVSPPRLAAQRTFVCKGFNLSSQSHCGCINAGRCFGGGGVVLLWKRVCWESERETKEFGRDCGKEASRFSPAGYSLSAALYMMS